MYLNHYSLKLKPFDESPDPSFFWLSEKHKEALACLTYCIIENKAFLTLTGDIGTGKTSLINYLLFKGQIDAVVATVVDPDLSIPDFFQLLANKFHIDEAIDTHANFLIQFEHFLRQTYSEEKKAILIIDEAQRLNQQLIEQIRLLSNIEKKDTKLVNIFLIGQNELIDLLKDEKNRALCQRIAVYYNLEPLTETETETYIRHRLEVAECKSDIFNDASIHEIFKFSRGYPRIINTICDRALLTGFVSHANRIDESVIRKCAAELKMISRSRVNKPNTKKKKVQKALIRKKLIETLDSFKKVLPFAHSGDKEKEVIHLAREWIVQRVPTIKKIVTRAGCGMTLPIGPTGGQSGISSSSIDPFDYIFHAPTGIDVITPICNMIDQTISVIQSGRHPRNLSSDRKRKITSHIDLSPTKSFLIYGNDNHSKQTLSRFLTKLGIEFISFNARANQEDTLIERIERYPDTKFAILLLPLAEEVVKTDEKSSIDDNVGHRLAIEIGYLMGKLGRKRVCALVSENMKIPSDLSRLLHFKMDASHMWRLLLVKQMKEAGLQIDLNHDRNSNLIHGEFSNKSVKIPDAEDKDNYLSGHFEQL